MIPDIREDQLSLLHPKQFGKTTIWPVGDCRSWSTRARESHRDIAWLERNMDSLQDTGDKAADVTVDFSGCPEENQGGSGSEQNHSDSYLECEYNSYRFLSKRKNNVWRI